MVRIFPVLRVGRRVIAGEADDAFLFAADFVAKKRTAGTMRGARDQSSRLSSGKRYRGDIGKRDESNLKRIIA